jgi:hypothetical protein
VGRLFKRLIIVTLVVFIVIQFVGPARTNPVSDPNRAISKHVPVPPDVKTLLDRGCWNCHSNQTVWPAYSYVAPVSWNVIAHVNDGRGSLNFSNWPEGPEEAGELLDAVCDEVVKKRTMPMPQYTWLHPEAKLTDAERKRLCDWANAAAAELY